MGTSAESAGIGKDPDQVDAEAPSDEQILEHLEQQAADVQEGHDDVDIPSRAALWEVIQEQRERMDQMAERIESLESQVQTVEQNVETVEDLADKLDNGKVGGESGADFVQEMADFPAANSLIDARSNQLFLKIISERMVGSPVTSSKIVKWMGFQDSANPSVKAKRVMERLKENREDGYYVGSVTLKKYRGKNTIWLGNTN